MRFRGGGVGHKSTREATDFFKRDRDPLDVPRQANTNDEENTEEWEEIEDDADEDPGSDEDVEDDYGLGFVTGNPRVFLGPPVPVPA